MREKLDVKEKLDWIKARKKLLAQLKSQVFAIQGRDKEIDAYAKNYKSEFRGVWRPSNTNELMAELTNCRVLLGGDFHAFSQSQRTHLRILRDWPKDKRVVLAVECIEAKHQKSLDAYMAGAIDDEEFLASCQWRDHWGFPWSHYKPLFDFAKSRDVPVFALNRYYKKKTLTSLVNRDLFAANKIVRIYNKYPQATIYTLFGDLHLATNHLPNYIKEIASESTIKIVRIFLNSEKLYFQLAKSNLESKVEVLMSSRSRFCVMSSPPWVKWQSYLMFLEGTYDDDLDGDYSLLDFTDHVAQLIQVMQKDIKVKITFDDLAVYTSEDFEACKKIASRLKLPDRELFLKLIEDEKSFMLPQQNFYYLSRISINHCAHLAGFYVHKKMSRLPRVLWSMPSDFLPLIWHEAVAFFLSKMINHKRKADRLSVIQNQLRHTEEKDQGREVLALVLDQKTDEWIYIRSGRHKRTRMDVKRTLSYIHAARILGSIMGEKLFEAHTVGRISQKALLSYLNQDLLAQDFSQFYYLMVKRLEANRAINAKEAQK